MQPSSAGSAIAVRTAATLIIGSLLGFSMACSGDARLQDSAALPEDQQAEVETGFMPRFELAHGGRIDLSEPVAAGLEQVLRQLEVGSVDPYRHSIRVTQAADADAGCLPGGTVWLSEGLLARVDDLAQLAAAMAWGLVQCPAASHIWLERDRLVLAPDRQGDPLAQRYRDFRLQANAPLYNLLVATACIMPDCDKQLRRLLDASGYGASSWDGLLTRLRARHPDSALVIRARDLVATGAVAAVGKTVPWLAPFAARREGLIEQAESRRRLDAGDLLEAYRAGRRARRLLDDSPQLQLHQAELDLSNRHYEYGQRILERLEGQGVTVPHADFWWGWVDVTLRRREQAAERFERALEILPRVSAHYWHAEALRRLGRLDEAERHYRTVLEAGPLHPDHERARIRLARMGAGD